MKPRLLDLFCGAGGCAKGYQRAGFYVVGVDIKPQPNYCGDRFVLAPYNAIGFNSRTGECYADVEPGFRLHLGIFDAIHASPPCQFGSTVTNRNRRRSTIEHPNLIPQTRELLQATGLPYVIENVEGSRKHLHEPTRICGSAFRDDLHRHRYFETNWALMSAPCAHGRRRRQFRSLDSRMVKRGSLSSVVGVHGHLNYPGEFELRKAAMEIDWMTVEELNQAIPPAYTQLIGHQLAQQLETRVA